MMIWRRYGAGKPACRVDWPDEPEALERAWAALNHPLPEF